MEIRYTDGKDHDFIQLCRMLDDNLDEMVGGATQRHEYNQYNKLDHIKDVFIIYDNEKPVGCASFKHYEEGTAELKRVFVRKEYRGRSLSKLLMERVEKRAKELGYRTMILETGKPLTEAIGLYTSLGYSITPNYGQYMNMPLSVCMRKDIREY